MDKAPFSFKFFTTTLGYTRKTKNGKPIYSKKLGRNRYSEISLEKFFEEYEEVCKRLNKLEQGGKMDA